MDLQEGRERKKCGEGGSGGGEEGGKARALETATTTSDAIPGPLCADPRRLLLPSSRMSSPGRSGIRSFPRPAISARIKSGRDPIRGPSTSMEILDVFLLPCWSSCEFRFRRVGSSMVVDLAGTADFGEGQICCGS